MSEDRMKEIYDSFDKNGRPLEELLTSNDKLQGSEAQTLRMCCTQYALHPADCSDFQFVSELMTGSKPKLTVRFESEVKSLGGGEKGKKLAIEKWETCKFYLLTLRLDSSSTKFLFCIDRDSPNRLPIYDILQIGAWTHLVRTGKIPSGFYDALEYLISIGVSVEGEDVAGYTALQYSLTCTPLQYDIRWSTTLLKASKDSIIAINHRNRYGTTAIHETFQSYKRPGETEMRLDVVKWILDRGGNVDIPDGDGSKARRTAQMYPQFRNLIAEYDQQLKQDDGCAFCRGGGLPGKGKAKVEDMPNEQFRATLRCGQCRDRLYCSPRCQKLDWKGHKPLCRP